MTKQIEENILKCLKQNKKLNILSISSHLKLDRHTTAKYLEILKTKKLVEYETKGKSKIWKLTKNPIQEELGVNNYISSQVLNALSKLDMDISIQSKNYDIIWYNSKENKGKCYELKKGKKEPCKNCPSEKVFKTGKTQTKQIKNKDEKTQIISEPILNEKGEVIAVIEIQKKVN